MRMKGWLVVLLAACSAPPAAKPVSSAPVTKAAPEPAPVEKAEVALPPPPPDVVAAFPDEVPMPDDAAADERLLRLLLADPAKAEEALSKMSAPDGFQVSVIAQFAMKRGEKSLELDAEPALPLPATDGGVVSAPGAAWLSVDAVPLLRGAKKLAVLPLSTKVEVLKLEGEWAEVSVPLAQLAVYAEATEEPEPVRVVTTPVRGRVRVDQLSLASHDSEALMRQALNQPDDDAGRLLAVALWHRAWRLERSERTRSGLLRAAWVAKRASMVVQAALAKNLVAASGLRFAWACTTEDPSQASWLELAQARPKTLPQSVCVSGLDARARCDDDTPGALKKAAATKEWLEGVGLEPKPWLRFTVDASDPRQAFVVTTPLQVADACSDFEEFTFEAGSGQVRRLALPLGSKTMVVWVPVGPHAGAEFSVISASSEGQAISWLRTRERYRWTLGRRGELEPSLGMNAMTYAVSADVKAASFALAPERDCSCQ